jgi:hypothetical protein
MYQPRGTNRQTNNERINTPLLLVCLAYIARNGGVAMPELLEVAREAGWPVSKPTMNRLLTDAEYHLGVRVRWSKNHQTPHGGEYVVEDWGMLDPRKVLERISSS